MTHAEQMMLVSMINEFGFDSGTVKKIDGTWKIYGKKNDVPKPIIKLSHWIEGRVVGVVIENQS